MSCAFDASHKRGAAIVFSILSMAAMPIAGDKPFQAGTALCRDLLPRIRDGSPLTRLSVVHSPFPLRDPMSLWQNR
jgi:hypothetical protein